VGTGFFLVRHDGRRAVRASQDYAYTLFVRNHVDEAAEIAEYRRLYGTNGVIVYEPGVPDVDYL